MATPTPAELRERSRLYREIAEKEITLPIKRRLAHHALALAQFAEKIERERGVRQHQRNASHEVQR